MDSLSILPVVLEPPVCRNHDEALKEPNEHHCESVIEPRSPTFKTRRTSSATYSCSTLATASLASSSVFFAIISFLIGIFTIVFQTYIIMRIRSSRMVLHYISILYSFSPNKREILTKLNLKIVAIPC